MEPRIDNVVISSIVLGNSDCLETIWNRSKDFEETKKSFDEIAVELICLHFISRTNKNSITSIVLRGYSKAITNSIVSYLQNYGFMIRLLTEKNETMIVCEIK